MHVKPRSQNCATESKLKLRDSTKRTLEMETSLDITTLPKPTTLSFKLSSNVTLSCLFFSSSREVNISILPVICCVHPLSRTQCFSLALLFTLQY
uniref:Uncharacterized protein n=1 Tax=Arundo donax TaxID=35708 RepID=A0A0A8YRA4_ARUDO